MAYRNELNEAKLIMREGACQKNVTIPGLIAGAPIPQTRPGLTWKMIFPGSNQEMRQCVGFFSFNDHIKQ